MPAPKTDIAKVINRRAGLNAPAPRGINKQNDRGALAQNEFWELINLRSSGGTWDVRGGLSAAINVVALTGCVTGFTDMPGQTAGILVNGVTLTLSPYGPDICTFYDPNVPDLTALNTGTMAQATETMPRYPLCLHAFSGDSEKRIFFLDSSQGISQLTLSTVPGQSLTDSRIYSSIVSLPHPANMLHSAFGKLWISTALGYLYSFDGTTLVEEKSGLGATAGLVCAYHESICHVNEDALAVRGSNGVWSTVALPAHSGTFVPRCIVQSPTQGKLYFGGYYRISTPKSNPVLFSFDGTSVTEEWTYDDVSETENFFDGVLDVVEWAGVATFIWHRWNIDHTGDVYIGTIASPTAVPVGDTATTNAVGMALFVDANAQLYASINAEWDGVASPNRLIRRDGTTLGGYWHTDANKSGWTAIGGAQWGIGGTDQPIGQVLSQL